MAVPNHRRVAVIGAGPSGIAAVHALTREKRFDVIRVFERRDRIGGTWIYDAEPDVFPSPDSETPPKRTAPSTIPGFAPQAPEDTTRRSGVYDALDSNVGAEVMSFTHTPFPRVNSALTVERFGPNNPTRPYKVVAGYLEDLFIEYFHLLTLNTTVEKLEKEGDEWVLTLRQSARQYRGQELDYWWTERFDAVIVATGHYSVPHVPAIAGLAEFKKKYPGKLEHSKSFRTANDYVGKRVVVVGGNVSASDLVVDLHSIVKGPLYVSQRGHNEALKSLWKLRNVHIVPTIKKLSLEDNGTVEFENGVKVSNVDKVVFGTGFRLSYPFIQPDPVTPQNRLAGFYQHIFKIGDPSLAVIGQVRAALSFRVYEYQAVAVARFLAGRATLPDIYKQKDWEVKRLAYKGPTTLFHEIAPDLKEYFEDLRAIAGPPAKDSDGYELPPWDDKWAELGFAVLALKEAYAQSLEPPTDETKLRAKL